MADKAQLKQQAAEAALKFIQHDDIVKYFIASDVLAAVEEGRTYEDLIEYTVGIEFRGHTVRVLNLKTLVELKRTSRDPKDRQSLPVLEETLRQLENG